MRWPEVRTPGGNRADARNKTTYTSILAHHGRASNAARARDDGSSELLTVEACQQLRRAGLARGLALTWVAKPGGKVTWYAAHAGRVECIGSLGNVQRLLRAVPHDEPAR